MINRLALNFFAIAPAAVSALILKTWFFLSNPKGAITGTFFSLLSVQ